MKILSSFIFGFSISLIGIALIRDNSVTPHRNIPNDLRINLFQAPQKEHIQSQNIFANIQKQSLQKTFSSEKLVPKEAFTIAHLDNLSNDIQSPSNSDVVYSPSDTEGEEDDIILNINTNDIIPIDINKDNLQSKNAEVSHIDNDNKIAMLPDYTADNLEENSPWVIAKGSKHIKNKKLLEKYTPDIQTNLLNKDLKLSSDKNSDVSYKVAEKIKQSIIFPIPDEILSDENLTPTFIQPKDTSKKEHVANNEKNTTKETKNTINVNSMKIIPKITPSSVSEETPKESKSIIDSLSSWLSPSSKKETPTEKKQEAPKKPPLYSSQDNANALSSPPENNSSNDAFVNFYETMQQAEQEHANNNIIPSELKLSFQPERAEISGQTLRWLKAFSEKSQEPSTFLQVRLDATAPIDLQRKRLSLLYSIFMNNEVDFKKVDTVFSLTEPDTFIIRIIKIKNNDKQI